MIAQEANAMEVAIAALVRRGQMDKGYALLSAVLAARTPFRLLENIGEPIGDAPPATLNIFLERVAMDKTEGGWVVIGSALRQQLCQDIGGAFAKCREFIIAADIWYGADILGERVPGPALMACFDPAMALLATWREDGNRWVRRRRRTLLGEALVRPAGAFRPRKGTFGFS